MWSDLLERVDVGRLQQLTLDFTRIRSYTGDSRQASQFYARTLREIGLAVEVYREYPQSPCVVARWRGGGGGPTLTLNGHMDTVPLDHPAPYVADGRIYGRGSADMKGGLIAIAEAVRVLAASGIRLGGDVQVIAHGLHENPDGHAEDITDLVRRGMAGDAVIIAEGASDTLPVVGLGQAMFEFTVSRPGPVTHEIRTPAGTPHPLLAAAQLVRLMQTRHAELAARPPIPYAGHESYFLGILQGGDFFNRWPTTCRLVGTRRYSPDVTAGDVRNELEVMARQVEAETGAGVAANLVPVRDGFRVAEDEPLVVSLRRAYRAVTGQELSLAGKRAVGDAPIFIREGKVPAVYHGPGGEGVHGDLESVPVAELVRTARVYVRTILDFLGTAG